MSEPAKETTVPGRGPGGPGVILAGRGLCYSRGGLHILADVDVTVRHGERLAVVGPSGSGKTTLLTLLAGVQRADRGQVTFDGTGLDGPTPEVSLVLQGYGLLPLLTAAENVEVAWRAAGHPAAEAPGRAAEVLAAMGLEEQADQLVQEMSGGQQQRAAIARAISLRPQVLLADEPTAEQDPSHRQLVVERLLEAAGDGALVLATHDPRTAEACDRVVHLHSGRVG